jgi:hypothetical protein
VARGTFTVQCAGASRGPSGSLSAQLAVTGLPTTYFLDRRHRVVGRIVGAGNRAEFEQGLRLALRHS